jgi:hypothetical protein
MAGNDADGDFSIAHLLRIDTEGTNAFFARQASFRELKIEPHRVE